MVYIETALGRGTSGLPWRTTVRHLLQRPASSTSALIGLCFQAQLLACSCPSLIFLLWSLLPSLSTEPPKIRWRPGLRSCFIGRRATPRRRKRPLLLQEDAFPARTGAIQPCAIRSTRRPLPEELRKSEDIHKEGTIRRSCRDVRVLPMYVVVKIRQGVWIMGGLKTMLWFRTCRGSIWMVVGVSNLPARCSSVPILMYSLLLLGSTIRPVPSSQQGPVGLGPSSDDGDVSTRNQPGLGQAGGRNQYLPTSTGDRNNTVVDHGTHQPQSSAATREPVTGQSQPEQLLSRKRSIPRKEVGSASAFQSSEHSNTNPSPTKPHIRQSSLNKPLPRFQGQAVSTSEPQPTTAQENTLLTSPLSKPIRGEDVLDRAQAHSFDTQVIEKVAPGMFLPTSSGR